MDREPAEPQHTLPPSPPGQDPAPQWIYAVLAFAILALGSFLLTVLKKNNEPDEIGSATPSIPVLTTPLQPLRQASTEIPKIGDGYQITGLINRGGQAEIYLAQSPTTGQRYAVKFPHSNQSGDPLAFIQEAEQSRRLLNSHIITVYKVGLEKETSRLFYIMDYFDGGTLRELLRQRGSFSEVTAIEDVVLPVLDGLNHAHTRTPPVIHRDLKPENILVKAKANRITDLKIIDFGLAFTPQNGRYIGTPPYVAPEVFEGDSPTAASDLFSVGVILLEMLQGRPPFGGGQISEMRRKILAGDYDLSGLSPPMATIVGRLLSLKPDDRFQSAEEAILACREVVFSSRELMTSG